MKKQITKRNPIAAAVTHKPQQIERDRRPILRLKLAREAAVEHLEGGR